MQKINDKERILKAPRKKQLSTRELIIQQKLCKPEGNGKNYLK